MLAGCSPASLYRDRHLDTIRAALFKTAPPASDTVPEGCTSFPSSPSISFSVYLSIYLSISLSHPPSPALPPSTSYCFFFIAHASSVWCLFASHLFLTCSLINLHTRHHGPAALASCSAGPPSLASVSVPLSASPTYSSWFRSAEPPEILSRSLTNCYMHNALSEVRLP